MNKFQIFLLDPVNKNIIDEIVQLYHPCTEIKTKVSTKYDWITIEGKGISIGIEFIIGISGNVFLGKGWKMDDFVKAYNTSAFRAWRFYDDSKYIKESPLKQDCPDVNQILANHNTPRPTPKQMFKYYYS